VARVTIIIEDDIVKNQEVVKMNIQHDPDCGTVKDKGKALFIRRYRGHGYQAFV
jgi:hypothetical protein